MYLKTLFMIYRQGPHVASVGTTKTIVGKIWLGRSVHAWIKILEEITMQIENLVEKLVSWCFINVWFDLAIFAIFLINCDT